MIQELIFTIAIVNLMNKMQTARITEIFVLFSLFEKHSFPSTNLHHKGQDWISPKLVTWV